MNTPHPPDPRFDDARWQAQERARRAVARGEGGEGVEPDARDLRVARALRHAPAVDLPPDFAARVAARAGAQAVEESHFEHALLRGLVLALALAAAVTVAWFGRGWGAALAAVLPGGADAVAWTTLAAACLLATWGWNALDGRQPRAQRGPA